MTLRRHFHVFICLIALFCSAAAAQRRNPDAAPTPAPAQEQAPKPAAPEPKKEAPEQPPVVTHHEIHVGGKTLRYTATTGMMPLRNNDTGEVEAHIFFMAYTLDGQTSEHRPLTFSFNGSPRSASVLLHLRAFCPNRLPMRPNGL